MRVEGQVMVVHAAGAGTVVLLGDLDDAIVEELARHLPPGAAQLHLEPDHFPASFPRVVMQADQVVVHLRSLGERELAGIQAIHAAGCARIMLVVGPHARAAMLERVRPMVHVLLPEATAPTAMRRLLGPGSRTMPQLAGLKVHVVAQEPALRFWLEEMLTQWRCRVLHAAQLETPPDGTEAIVWVLPWLESGWEASLARASARQPVIALIPFADRLLVDRVLGLGAHACLDLNGDPADLGDVLERLAAPLRAASERAADAPHAVPPPPHVAQAARRPVVSPDLAE